MTAKLRSLIVVSIVGSIGVGTISAKVLASEKVGGAEWKVRMQQMLSDVVALVPFAFDDAKFNDPKNSATIQSSLNSLAKHSLELKKHTTHVQSRTQNKTDPSFAFIADSFESEAVLAKSQFESGGSARARSQNYLRLALSKCVVCHTQSNNGPQLKLDQFKNQFALLSASDRLMALTATRQFDAALEEFGQYVKDAKVVRPDDRQFDRNARAMLSVAVRVKRDPAQAKSLLSQILSSGAGSPVLQREAQSWKKSVADWESEKAPAANTEKALFSEAKRLVDANKIRPDSESFDRSQIDLLRASTYLHDLLLNFPTSPNRGESFLMLAAIYDSLPGFAIWDLGDEYLVSCIREFPHSETAEKCFEQYNNSILFGYTGSSGTHIPAAVRSQVEKMKSLAKRKNSKRDK